MIPFGPSREHTGISPPQLWISSRPSSLSSAPWAGGGFPCPFSRGLLLPSLPCSREAGQGFVDRRSFLYLSLPSGSPEPAGAGASPRCQRHCQESGREDPTPPTPIKKPVKNRPERPHMKGQEKPLTPWIPQVPGKGHPLIRKGRPRGLQPTPANCSSPSANPFHTKTGKSAEINPARNSAKRTGCVWIQGSLP